MVSLTMHIHPEPITAEMMLIRGDHPGSSCANIFGNVYIRLTIEMALETFLHLNPMGMSVAKLLPRAIDRYCVDCSY